MSGRGTPRGWGPKATGPDSVVPQPFVTAAPGKARLHAIDERLGERRRADGDASTDERSVRASAAGLLERQRHHGRDDVSHVQRWRPIASM